MTEMSRVPEGLTLAFLFLCAVFAVTWAVPADEVLEVAESRYEEGPDGQQGGGGHHHHGGGYPYGRR